MRPVRRSCCCCRSPPRGSCGRRRRRRRLRAAAAAAHGPATGDPRRPGAQPVCRALIRLRLSASSRPPASARARGGDAAGAGACRNGVRVCPGLPGDSKVPAGRGPGAEARRPREKESGTLAPSPVPPAQACAGHAGGGHLRLAIRPCRPVSTARPASVRGFGLGLDKRKSPARAELPFRDTTCLTPCPD